MLIRCAEGAESPCLKYGRRRSVQARANANRASTGSAASEATRRGRSKAGGAAGGLRPLCGAECPPINDLRNRPTKRDSSGWGYRVHKCRVGRMTPKLSCGRFNDGSMLPTHGTNQSGRYHYFLTPRARQLQRYVKPLAH